MSTRLYSFLLLVSCVLLAFVYVPPLISWEFLRPKIAAVIQDSLPPSANIKVEMLGALRVRLLPKVVVEVANVHLSKVAPNQAAQKLLEANNVSCTISLLDLFGNKLDITVLKVANGLLRVSAGNPWWNDITNNKILHNSLQKISLENMEIIWQGDLSDAQTGLDSVTADLFLGMHKSIEQIHGHTQLLGEPGYFNIDFKWDPNTKSGKLANGYLTTTSLQLQLSADEVLAKNNIWGGKLALRILDNRVLIKYIIPSDKLSSVANEPVDMHGNVVLGKDNFTIDGLNFTQGDMQASFALQANLSAQPKIQAKLVFDQLKIDNGANYLSAWYDGLVRTGAEQSGARDSCKNLLKLLLEDTSKQMPIAIDIAFNKLILHNTTLDPFAIGLTAEDGAAVLAPLNINLPGGSNLQMQGQLISDTHMLKLELPLQFAASNAHEFYQWLTDSTPPATSEVPVAQKLHGQLNLSEYGLEFIDIGGRYGPTVFGGKVNVRSDVAPLYDVVLDIKNLDEDAKVITDSIQDKLTALADSIISESPPADNWLKAFPNVLNLSLTLQDSKLAGQAYNKIELLGQVQNSLLELTHLNVEHPQAAFAAQLNYDLRPVRPILHAEWSGKQVATSYLQQNLPTGLVNMAIFSADGKGWSEQKLTIPALNRVDGSLRVRCKQITNNNAAVINDFDLSANMQNEDLNIKSLTFNYPQLTVYPGATEPRKTEVTFKADISYNPFAILGALSVNDFQFTAANWSFLPATVQDGFGSVSGTFSTDGSSWRRWVERLNLSLSSTFTNIKLKGPDLDLFISSFNHPDQRKSELVDSNFQAAQSTDTYTQIYGLSASIVGKEGQFQLKDGLFNTMYSSAALNGTLDLRKRELNLKTKSAFALAGTKLNLSYGANLAGNFSSPVVSFDFADLKASLVNQPLTTVPAK